MECPKNKTLWKTCTCEVDAKGVMEDDDGAVCICPKCDLTCRQCEDEKLWNWWKVKFYRGECDNT